MRPQNCPLWHMESHFELKDPQREAFSKPYLGADTSEKSGLL